ncbi:MAG: hypothetical protein U9O86_04970 [Campylobacterota bacterium]|nr:hypothetical protein [Campylobacterota bacterium]
MRIMYFSLKGGVGKTSLSLNHAIEKSYAYVTNDVTSNIDESQLYEYHEIQAKKKRIPQKLTHLKEVIFDFGAMYDSIDPKVTHGAKICDGVVIPTFTDERSLEATIEAYRFILQHTENIIIVINNYTKEKKYDYAYKRLCEALNNPIVLGVRTTTLFERVARDGIEWFKNINHAKGEYQLSKTKEIHQQLYNEINYLTGARNEIIANII